LFKVHVYRLTLTYISSPKNMYIIYLQYQEYVYQLVCSVLKVNILIIFITIYLCDLQKKTFKF